MTAPRFISASDVVSFQPRRPIAYFGDSRISQGYNSNAGVGPIGITLCKGLANWVEVLSNVAARATPASSFNFGVSGETTTQMLARITPVLASPADVVVFWGGVNNFIQSGSLSTAISDLEAIKTAVLNAGKIFVPIAETPVSSPSTALTGQALGNQLRYADYIRRLSSQDGVIPIDPWPVVADRISGAWIANLSTDGLHPGPGASLRIARLIVAQINKFYPASTYLPCSNLDLYDATNNPQGALTSNPFMNGTSGTNSTNSSGSIATGWTSKGTADLAVVASKQTINGQVVQRLTISGTPASDQVIDFNVGSVTIGNLNIADVVYASMQFGIAAGNNGLFGCSLVMNNFTTGTDSPMGSYYNSGDLAMPDDGSPIAGTIITQDWTVPNPKPAGIGLHAYFAFKSGIAANAVIDIYGISARKR